MAKTDNNYRIKANIGSDTILKVPLKRDIDFLEILSLKISQKGLYKLHASNYGVVIGRVLANDGFGVPNARLSVFVKLSDEDAKNTDLTQYYPYTSISTRDKEHRRYNLLPDNKNNDCYRIVGTFPNKRLVLDNDTQIEIFDKYWKYTTTTNASGDYMILGVPTGSQTIHVDIDLSNIGILSQKPRDMVYKGYNVTAFDNASQFKESTNLDNLVQIISQDNTVNVYPFWGDKDAEGIVSITRQDINIAYKFETTCIFMGSIASDNNTNSLGHECTPTKKMGYNSGLVASEGTIEMIRKTQDGLVEEVQIQGNQLIDGDGVWCYQIPMNLDYVVTDEFGHIVPTDNPNKGIPTRTSVRFRFSVNETGSEGISRHRAEYLVPNNPMPTNGQNDWTNSSSNTAAMQTPLMDNWGSFEKNYEFGSATPDECFRDLYWNKVYSVKNYIPRLQSTKSTTTDQYTGIRTINYHQNISPFPFNNVRFKFPFSYMFLCMLMEVFFVIIAAINAILSLLRLICIPPFTFKIFGFKFPQWCVFNFIQCITMKIEDDEAGDGSILTYAPGCFGHPPKGAIIGNMSSYTNRMQRGLASDAEVINFDFYNDWINGCLYMPLWFWKKTKKKKYFFGLFSKKAHNKFCSSSDTTKNLRLAQGCPIDVTKPDDFVKNVHNSLRLIRLPYGVIHEKTNKDGLNVYYYCPATTTTSKNTSGAVPFIRLFATDIILLGSVADCDLDSIPKMFSRLPSTTANIPFMVSTKIATDNSDDVSLEMTETTPLSVTGMDWGHKEGKAPNKLTKGLLMDLSCSSVTTYRKSIINTRRLSELGVTLDGAYDMITPSSDGSLRYKEVEPDGLVTRIEINDLESRAMFATLNHNGLDKQVYSPITKYNTYKLQYLYPIEFDGELKKTCESYTSNKTTDEANLSYLMFRYGTDGYSKWSYSSVDKGDKQNKNMFPMYNNSFYFYFGINPGKTALEKFYTNFYSDCFNNVKEPFTASVSGTPGSWCNQNAHADIELSKIRAPYRVEVIDSMGISFITLDNLEYPSVKLDFWDDGDQDLHLSSSDEESMATIREGMHGFIEDFRYNKKLKFEGLTEDDIDAAINDGYIYQAFGNSFYQVLSRDLTNGLYIVKITDAYNREQSFELNLMQSTLNIDIESYNLSDKYEVNKFVDEGSSGKIIIKSLFIDGKEYRFKKDEETQVEPTDEEGVYYIYGYEVIPNPKEKLDDNDDDYIFGDESNKIRLSIMPQNIHGDNLVHGFDDVSYYDGNEKMPFLEPYPTISAYGKNIDDNSIVITFKVKTADQFNVSAIMYCGKNDDVESDNVYETTVNIDNSDPMVLLLQNVDSEIIAQPSSVEDSIIEWANIYDPKYYNFPKCNADNQDWWNNYVDMLSDFTDESSNVKENIIRTVNYQLNCVLGVSNAVFSIGSQSNVEFSSTGGSKPTMYSVCPDYGGVGNSNNSIPNNRFSDYIYSNTSTTIQANSNYPTLINANYYTTPTEIKTTLNWGYRLNNIFKFDNTTKQLGNYVGLIDSNNTNRTKPSNIVQLDKDKLGIQKDIDLNDVEKYFKSHVVDRRADYELHVIKDIGTNKIKIDTDESMFFGGIAFAHKNYNIVSNNDDDIEYEYTYNGDEYASLRYNDSCNSFKKYYKLAFTTNISSNPFGDVDMLNIWKNEGSLEFPRFKCDKDIIVGDELICERGSSLSWEQTSFSYNTNSAVVSDDEGKYSIECEVYDGESIDGTIGTVPHLKTLAKNMEEAAKNDCYNVLFENNSTTKVNNKNGVNLRYSIDVDSDTNHSVYTNAPIFISADNENEHLDVKTIISNYNNKAVKDTEVIILEEYKDYYQQLSDSSNKAKYISSVDNPTQRLADDDSLRSAVSYKLKVSKGKSGFPVVAREYIDNSFETTRLARKVFVYEVGNFIDKNDTSDGCFNINVSVSKGNMWNKFVKNNPQVPTAQGKNNKGKICYVQITCLGGSSVQGVETASDFVEVDEVTGKYMIAIRISGSDVYTDAYRVVDVNPITRKETVRFIVPLYNNLVEGEEDENEAEDDDTDDVVTVNPLWYKPKKVHIYIKCKNNLIYRYWFKKL